MAKKERRYNAITAVRSDEAWKRIVAGMAKELNLSVSEFIRRAVKQGAKTVFEKAKAPAPTDMRYQELKADMERLIAKLEDLMRD